MRRECALVAHSIVILPIPRDLLISYSELVLLQRTLRLYELLRDAPPHEPPTRLITACDAQIFNFISHAQSMSWALILKPWRMRMTLADELRRRHECMARMIFSELYAHIETPKERDAYRYDS